MVFRLGTNVHVDFPAFSYAKEAHVMKTFIITLILLILTPIASAEELYFKYGMQVPGADRSSKVFGLTYEERFVWGTVYTYEADLLNTPSDTNTTAFLLSPGIGVKVNKESYFATAVWGPAYLSQTDQDLGGHFQFMQNLTLGIQDYYSTIGVGYQHISSAGIEKPNRGKDNIYIRIGLKF